MTRRLGPGVLVALGLLLAAGCGQRSIPAPTGGSDVPPSKVNLPRAVDLCQVEQRSLVSAVETVGLIEPEARTEIAAGIAGLVDEVMFREGDVVDPRDGHPLIRIDPKRYRDQLRVAEAAEKRVIANV